MAARTPRRSFATPFVVTLAAAPACYVQSGPPPQGPPPQPQPTQTAQPQPEQARPPVIVSPPMPTQPTTEPSTPPAPPPTQQNQSQKWTVYKAQTGGGCMAAFKVECQPKATCNPPPPFKYECPPNVSLEKPITVATYDGTSCFVEFEDRKSTRLNSSHGYISYAVF